MKPLVTYLFAGTLPVLLVISIPLVATQTTTGKDASVLLEGIPHVVQKTDFCGEACTEMVLAYNGVKGDQDWVFDQTGLTPLQGRGAYTKDLKKALETIGFDVGKVWYHISSSKAEASMEALWQDMHRDLLEGIPSIVCMHFDSSPSTTEHFRLVVGYDAADDEIIYHEPAKANGAYLHMDKATFMDLWPLKYEEDVWTVIRFAMKPGDSLIEGEAATGFTDADYTQHYMKLKAKLPSDDFTVVLERPFFVIGDEAPSKVKSRAAGTVKWAVEHLKALYFDQDPNQILDIWLFEDDKSYMYHAKLLFGSKPDTPFGYFSSTHGALVMNIATGGGTLVHEIVHPFMESNFPDCPAWFNEGMGSLYEQCGSKKVTTADGTGSMIVGYTNWRLEGLQQGIAAKEIPSFHVLTHTTTDEFYDMFYGYGQARYLCYYLQEKGLLVAYYDAFTANHDKDPSGYETLRKVLGVKDMAAFQQQWEAWVMALTYP